MRPDSIQVFERAFRFLLATIAKLDFQSGPKLLHNDFRTFLCALFEASPKCAQVPNLAQCFTIYQIEHETQQIIWNVTEAELWRVPRLVRWMDGYVDDLFREIAPQKANLHP